MALTGSAVLAEIAEAKRFGQVEGRGQGRKEGKIAGIRLAAEELRKWSRQQELRVGVGAPSATVLEDAADSLATIADRLEEEG